MWLTNVRHYTNLSKIISVEIMDGKITAIDSCCTHEGIDGKGYVIIPGLIDLHVHLREPGFTHKETFATGTQAAIQGGFTTIAAMPNVNPVPDTVEQMKIYQQQAKLHSKCNVILYGSLTKNLEGKEIVKSTLLNEQCGTLLFSDDGKGVQAETRMEEIFKEHHNKETIVVTHLEDETILKPGASIHDGYKAKELSLKGIPSSVEYVPLQRDIQLLEKYNVNYHACHLSTLESVNIIRKAKEKGLKVTSEVCIHHLLLNESAVVSTMHKMNPPLRSNEDQFALLEGVIDGTIDYIVSDHAPHTLDEKSRGFEDSPFGIVGLETNLPLAYTYLVRNNKISFKKMIDCMSTGPAEKLKLKTKGAVDIGFDADLVLLDIEQKTIIDSSTFASKGVNTPFDGWEVYGKVMTTIINGKVVYQR